MEEGKEERGVAFQPLGCPTLVLGLAPSRPRIPALHTGTHTGVSRGCSWGSQWYDLSKPRVGPSSIPRGLKGQGAFCKEEGSPEPRRQASRAVPELRCSAV